MIKKIIATGTLDYAGMSIPVNIHEIETPFGMVNFTVSPIGGKGQSVKQAVTVESWTNDTYKEIYLPKINS